MRTSRVQVDDGPEVPPVLSDCGIVVAGPRDVILQWVRDAEVAGLTLLQIRHAAKAKILSSEELQKLKDQIKKLSRQLNIARGKITKLQRLGGSEV